MRHFLTDVQGTWPFLSALLLQYPLKPSSLSDDLESFVYVLLQCALRFHEHHMGRVVSSTSSISKRELASHNQWYNTGLAGFVNYLFYQEYKEGTHTLGGDSKLDRIAVSSPGLRMIKVKRRSVIREHPMQRLLDDLYSLLRVRVFPAIVLMYSRSSYVLD